MRDDAKLQAIPVETHARQGLPRVVHGRFVAPAGQDVQVLPVIHGVNPDGHPLALILHVAAGEDAAGEVPVAGLAVDCHLAGGRQDGNAVVLGLRGRGRTGPEDRDGKREPGAQGKSSHVRVSS